MDLNSKLIDLNDLYCKECRNFFNIPIMQSKGENICGRCYKKIRTHSDYIPNVALQNIIKLLIIPCRYKLEGCKMQLSYIEMTQHEQICSFRTHKCFSIGNCEWTGSLNNMVLHFETNHHYLLLKSDNCVFDLSVNITETPGYIENKLMFWNTELFLLQIKIDTEKLYFAVSYVGENYLENNLQYSVEEIGAAKGICVKQNEKKDINYSSPNMLDSIGVDLRILRMCNADMLDVKLKIHADSLMVSGETDENILMHLECPVCNQYMLPPIHQCLSGHNVCNKCRPKLGQCPTCRGRLENTRNYALEAVSATTRYPCMNRDHGCKIVVPGSMIEKHENECKLQRYQCPVGENNCMWSGKQSELMGHLVNVHKLNDQYQIKINISQRPNAYPSLMTGGSNNYKTVIAYGEIFKVGYKYYNTSTTYWACKVVGTKNRHKFKYEISYSNESQDFKIVRNSDCFVFCSDDDFYSNCLYFSHSITSAVGNLVTCTITRN